MFTSNRVFFKSRIPLFRLYAPWSLGTTMLHFASACNDFLKYTTEQFINRLTCLLVIVHIFKIKLFVWVVCVGCRYIKCLNYFCLLLDLMPVNILIIESCFIFSKKLKTQSINQKPHGYLSIIYFKCMFVGYTFPYTHCALDGF